MVAATPDVLPPATAALHTAAASIMYVFVGSGWLLEFCARAEQQALRPPAEPPPWCTGAALAEGAGGAPASMGFSCSGAGGVVATGAAVGKGGGGSSFLQPVTAGAASKTSAATNDPEVFPDIAGRFAHLRAV